MEQRLIDANAFKKENERLLHCDFPYLSETTLEELIDEAPTIDAVPHWIPCSERLPEEDGDYFVFDSEEYYGVDAYYTHNGTEEYGICLAYKGWQSYHHVEYWMQIPKLPYEVKE